MGKAYKLGPEVIGHILELKKTKPDVSCRTLSEEIRKKFSLKVSKSSINNIFKGAQLSGKVGRPRVFRKPQVTKSQVTTSQEKAGKSSISGLQIGNQPPILVTFEKTGDSPQKAGTVPIVPPVVEQPAAPIEMPAPETSESAETQVTRHKTQEISPAPAGTETTGEILLKAVDILFGGLCSSASAGEDMFSSFQKDIAHSTDFLKKIAHVFKETRAVKFKLMNSEDVYLDGQNHTVWSSPYLPCDFSLPVYSAKKSLQKCLQNDLPLVLLRSPDFEASLPAFLEFLAQLDSDKKIYNLEFLNDNLQPNDRLEINSDKRQYFLFGHFPWQFGHLFRFKSTSEFELFEHKISQKSLYIAEISAEFVSIMSKQPILLTGSALKNSLDDKIQLLILSNIPAEKADFRQLTETYLNHWPNPQEAFADFGRKVELFSYSAGTFRSFSAEIDNMKRAAIMNDPKALFVNYLKMLDLYLRWHLLPVEYEDKLFSTVKEQFYDLKVALETKEDCIFARFILPADYRFRQDLSCLIQRLNERQVKFSDGRKLWLSL